MLNATLKSTPPPPTLTHKQIKQIKSSNLDFSHKKISVLISLLWPGIPDLPHCTKNNRIFLMTCNTYLVQKLQIQFIDSFWDSVCNRRFGTVRAQAFLWKAKYHYFKFRYFIVMTHEYAIYPRNIYKKRLKYKCL